MQKQPFKAKNSGAQERLVESRNLDFPRGFWGNPTDSYLKERLDHPRVIKRLRQWFLMLRISPSYELARKYRCGEKLSQAQLKRIESDPIFQEAEIHKILRVHKIPKPPHHTIDMFGRLVFIDEVESIPIMFFVRFLAVYDQWGDVWSQTFEEWLKNNPTYLKEKNKNKFAIHKVSELSQDRIPINGGFHYLVSNDLANFLNDKWGSETSTNGVLLYVPLNFEKKTLHEELDRLIDEHKKEKNDPDQIRSDRLTRLNSFAIRNTRLRDGVLEKLYELICLKATNSKLKTWELAEKIKVGQKYVGVIKKLELKKIQFKKSGKKLTISELDALNANKELLNAVIGRYLRSAFILSENAGIGAFPKLNLDSILVSNQYYRQTEFDFEGILLGLEREKNSNKEKIRLTQRRPSIELDSNTNKPQWY